jgi:hypothetical protein
MAKITIYLRDEVESKVRKAAWSDGVSVSRWIAARVSSLVDDGPAVELLRLAGMCPDFPDIEQLREGIGSDAAREPVA